MTSYNRSCYGDEGQLMDAAIRANKSFYMEIQRLKDRMQWRAVVDCRPPFDESIEFAEPTRVLPGLVVKFDNRAAGDLAKWLEEVKA